jgi:hypothetical protein
VAFSPPPPPLGSCSLRNRKKEKIILKKRTIPSSISRLCLIDKEMIYRRWEPFSYLFLFFIYWADKKEASRAQYTKSQHGKHQ